MISFTEIVRFEIRGSHNLDCEDCRILGCEPLSLIEIYQCIFPYDGSIFPLRRSAYPDCFTSCPRVRYSTFHVAGEKVPVWVILCTHICRQNLDEKRSLIL